VSVGVRSGTLGDKHLLQAPAGPSDLERALQEKNSDPVAAAIGAYALLRLGELDRLHDWTANLFDWFPWLADAAAIRGEHLARLGRHEEALDALRTMRGRGLPLFGRGLGYALARLQTYAALSPDTLGAARHAQAAAAREALGRAA